MKGKKNIVLFCLNVCIHRKDVNPLLLVTYTYGGSTLAAAIVGYTPFMIANRYALPILFFTKILVEFVPLEWFAIPLIDSIVKIGTEICRTFIVATWFVNGEALFGENSYIPSVLLATIAASFGIVLGSMSLNPIFSSITIRSLFIGNIFYGLIPKRNSDEKFVAMTCLILWMLFAQHLLPNILISMNQRRGKSTKSD